MADIAEERGRSAAASKRKRERHWSASSLGSLYQCVRLFAFQYHEKPEVATPAIMVFGSSLHYAFQRFFEVRYKSADSFCGFFRGFWHGVLEGEHGPDGQLRPAIVIAAKTDELLKFYGIGTRICRMFFEQNSHWYERPKSEWPKVEQRITFSIAMMPVVGKIDRLELADGRIEVWDYKGSSFSTVKWLQDLQLAVYTAWVLATYGRPPDRLVIHNYYTGKSQSFRARTMLDLARLEQLLVEAQLFVDVLLGKRALTPAMRLQLPHFTGAQLDAAARGIALPILPVCPVADKCMYREPCAAWVAQYRRGIRAPRTPPRMLAVRRAAPDESKQLVLQFPKPRKKKVKTATA